MSGAPVEESITVQLNRMEKMLMKLVAQTAPKQPSDDGKVFKDPPAKYWDGESYSGNKFSECPPDFLRAFAKYKRACVWANKKEADPAKAQYAEKDEATAKVATAWAEYHEASGTEWEESEAEPPPKTQRRSAPIDEFGPPSGGDDDIPF